MTSKTYVVGKVEKESPPRPINRDSQPTHYTTAPQPGVQAPQMTQSHPIPVPSTNNNNNNNSNSSSSTGSTHSSSSIVNNNEKGYNNASHQNQVGNVILAGVPIVSLFIDAKERLCLAQISNTLLSKYSYNEIHNRRVALGITCVQCTPVQLEMLRRAGAMPVSSRRCGMITKREAERLVRSFLEENTPPKLPEDFTFSVYHECGWGCQGSFHPSRYNSSRAKCIKCNFCNLFFSPNKFIFHFHRTANSKYNHPDAANFNSWRRHLKLYGENSENNEFVCAWEDVKAMFNGGGRKRLQGGSSTQNSTSNNQQLEKRTKLDTNNEGIPGIGVGGIGTVSVVGTSTTGGTMPGSVIVKERSPYTVSDCQPFSMFANPLRNPSFQTPTSYGLAMTGANTPDQLIPTITSNPWGTNQTNFLMATYDRFWASHLGLSRPTTEFQTNPYFMKALPNSGPKDSSEINQSLNLTPSSSEEEDSGTSSSNEEDLNKPPIVGHRLSAFRPVNPVNSRPKSATDVDKQMVAPTSDFISEREGEKTIGVSLDGDSHMHLSDANTEEEEDPCIEIDVLDESEDKCSVLEGGASDTLGEEETALSVGALGETAGVTSRAVAVISKNRNRPESLGDKRLTDHELDDNSTQQHQQSASLHHHTHQHHSHHHQHEQQLQHHQRLQQQQLKTEESDEELKVDAEMEEASNEVYRTRCNQTPLDTFEQQQRQQLQQQISLVKNDLDLMSNNTVDVIRSVSPAPNILTMTKEELHEQLIQEIQSRRKIEKECQIIKETFQEQVKEERKHRDEMQQQINLVQESLTSELEQERKARLTLQEKLKVPVDLCNIYRHNPGLSHHNPMRSEVWSENLGRPRQRSTSGFCPFSLPHQKPTMPCTVFPARCWPQDSVGNTTTKVATAPYHDEHLRSKDRTSPPQISKQVCNNRDIR